MSNGPGPSETTSINAPTLLKWAFGVIVAVTLLSLLVLMIFAFFIPEPSESQKDVLGTFDDLAKAGFAFAIGLLAGKFTPLA